ncbi:MAG: YdcF family protein [Holophagales bacterium]|nr:YdcF family protein [Holophagales bacterium]
MRSSRRAPRLEDRGHARPSAESRDPPRPRRARHGTAAPGSARGHLRLPRAGDSRHGIAPGGERRPRSLARARVPAPPTPPPRRRRGYRRPGRAWPRGPPRLGPELVDSSDRILHAARLFRAGKAPLVIPTGGRLPWTPAPRTEAAGIADLLVEWGVPRTAIVRGGRPDDLRQRGRDREAPPRARREARPPRHLVAPCVRALASFRAEGARGDPVTLRRPRRCAEAARGLD